MLNEFLEVAYKQELTKQGQAELEGLLTKLPVAELRKLADGTPIAEAYGHLEKKAFLENAPKAAGCDENFLDRFKGSPLFDQALALEQEEIQADMLRQQRNEEQRQEGDVWQLRDKIRLKKRLLELELAKQDAGVGAPPAAPPGEPAQGAGAPGPVPAEGVQDSSSGLGGGVAKMGADKAALSREGITKHIVNAVEKGQATPERLARATKHIGETAKRIGSAGGTLFGQRGKLVGNTAHALDEVGKLGSSPEEKVAFADALGRELARAEFEKAAHAQVLTSIGSMAGALMAKTAIDWGGLAKTVGGMGTRAMGMAAKNPAAAGAALGAGVGALGGAVAGGPGHRLGGALGGAALGGAAGGGAGHIAGGGGGALGQKVRSGVSTGLGKLRGMVGGGPSPAPQMQLPGV